MLNIVKDILGTPIEVLPPVGYTIVKTTSFDAKLQPVTSSSGNPQPMLVTQDGQIIVDSQGHVVYQPLIDYINSLFGINLPYGYTTKTSGFAEAFYYGRYLGEVKGQKTVKVYISAGEYFLGLLSQFPGIGSFGSAALAWSPNNVYTFILEGDGDKTIVHLPVNDNSNPQAWLFTVKNPAGGDRFVIKSIKFINDTAKYYTNINHYYMGLIVTWGGGYNNFPISNVSVFNNTGVGGGTFIEDVTYVLDDAEAGWTTWFNNTVGAFLIRFRELFGPGGVSRNYNGGNILYDSGAYGMITDSQFITYNTPGMNSLDVVDLGTGRVMLESSYVEGFNHIGWMGTCDGESELDIVGVHNGVGNIGAGGIGFIYTHYVVGWGNTNGRISVRDITFAGRWDTGYLWDCHGSGIDTVEFVNNVFVGDNGGVNFCSGGTKYVFKGNFFGQVPFWGRCCNPACGSHSNVSADATIIMEDNTFYQLGYADGEQYTPGSLLPLQGPSSPPGVNVTIISRGNYIGNIDKSIQNCNGITTVLSPQAFGLVAAGGYVNLKVIEEGDRYELPNSMVFFTINANNNLPNGVLTPIVTGSIYVYAKDIIAKNVTSYVIGINPSMAVVTSIEKVSGFDIPSW